MRFAFLFGIGIGIGIAAIGCSSKTGTGESTMQGSVALTTFPSAPTSMNVRDETGHVTMVQIGSNGAFSTALPSGHTYKLSLVTANGEIPLVYPRQTGSIDATFAVRSNGARVALGAVRYFPSAPSGGFKVLSGAQPTHDDEVDDDQTVSCEDGQSGTDEKESASSGEQANASAEMAVGEHNAPEHVDGCDGNESEQESKN